MHTKKTLIVLILLAMIFSLLPGVGLAQDKPSGPMVFMVQEPNQQVFENTTLEGFLAEYPDIEIEWVNHAPDEVANQVALAIMGGTGAPDLAVTENRSIAQLVELGGLMDLTPWLNLILMT
ncbi:extracellular solute-binding protein [Chloroflexota bacterium]